MKKEFEKNAPVIVFEGGEGSGKGTLINILKNYLEHYDFKCLFTREPGGIGISEKIREIIVSNDSGNLDSITEVLLFQAARRQHLVEKVLPALDEGKVVFFDRFYHSTYAYQGYGRGIDMKIIKETTDIATGGLTPDLVFFLNLSPEEGLERIEKSQERRDSKNRLDKESLAFHQRVNHGYNNLLKNDRTFVSIDATQDPVDVFEDVVEILEDKFPDFFKGVKE